MENILQTLHQNNRNSRLPMFAFSENHGTAISYIFYVVILISACSNKVNNYIFRNIFIENIYANLHFFLRNIYVPCKNFAKTRSYISIRDNDIRKFYYFFIKESTRPINHRYTIFKIRFICLILYNA